MQPGRVGIAYHLFLICVDNLYEREWVKRMGRIGNEQIAVMVVHDYLFS